MITNIQKWQHRQTSTPYKGGKGKQQHKERASRIKGITIELDGDATKLESSLKKVNSSIKTTESALRDVNKLLKLDPSNTTLLTQKYNLLQTEITDTRTKLAALKEADKQAKQQLEAGTMGQEKYDALQREIIETEEKLKSLENTVGSGEAEAGGTAISTVMTNIDKAVSTNADTLETWAQTAGLSASEFKSAWEQDAYGAMQKVVKGMSDTSESGGNLNVLLDELGVTGIRTSDTMKRLSNASDLMTEMTNLSNEAWEENTALVDESDRVYDTFAAELGKTKEALKQAGEAIGTQLMPYIQKAAEFVKDLAVRFSEMSPAAQKAVAAVLAIVAAAAPLLIMIGKVSMGISSITGLLSKAKVGTFFSSILKGAGAAKKVGTFFSSILKGAGAANGGLLAMIAPIAGVVAAVVGLIAIFVTLWKTNEDFRNNVTALWEQIKELISTVIESIKAIFSAFVELAGALWSAFGDDIMNVVNTVFNAIGPIINAALQIVQGIIQTITAVIQGDWSGAWEGGQL
ncbi:hypothetical protein QE152_g38941 [Popillia japonica]|uniref:Uncharacterized protein n=1 Tax=Popillia japonica TaxID=7064 RepID=A0AAW1HVJ6_POPJA